MTRKTSRGFTLIELLIVIAIILILIAIALPNFLEAQFRARVTRVKADQRNIATAIEAFRTERNVLLIDFWDDGRPEASIRWKNKFGKVGRNPGTLNIDGVGGGVYDFFEECFYPLTSPAEYLLDVPIDLFNERRRQVGFSAQETGVGYIYFDNDEEFKLDQDHGIHRFNYGHPFNALTQTPMLREGEFALISVGPDTCVGTLRGRNCTGDDRGHAYAPTNGTRSDGDIVFRSAGPRD